ncbi:MAG: hypothetical protein ACK4R6_09120 [Spirosomataceae bacterium]
MKKYPFLLFFLLISTLEMARVTIINGLTHIHSLKPGSTTKGQLILRNDSKKEARVVVYKQDLSSICDKQIEYLEEGSQPRSLSKMLRTVVDEKVLVPQEEFVLPYLIDTPPNQLENGSYWSVLMVEVVDPVREEQANGLIVNSLVRYAVQIIGHLGTYQSPILEILKIDAKDLDKSVKTLQVQVKNTQLYMATSKAILELYDTTGKKIKTVKSLDKKIYPNSCTQFELQFTDIPKGKYACILLVDNGRDMFGSNVTIDVD